MLARPQIILGFPDYVKPGENLARELNVDFSLVDVHRFPDGESKITLPDKLPESVLLCRSLDKPNDKLIELLLSADTARELGAQQVSLVAPYLCYMRQDIAFKPGEAISQKIIGQCIATHFDAVLTVDAHLHRINDISQAVPAPQAINLSAAEMIGHFIGRELDNPILLGPDEESQQWVKIAAEVGGFEYGVATKERYGDRDVAISLPDLAFTNREVVIVDDMASTGKTLMAAAEHLKAQRAVNIHCVVTHALFYEEAIEKMHSTGFTNIWSTDSVIHPSNSIALSQLLASAFSP
ncbi:ribose-phosphate diphosphokinase [Kaarinaea lacus]